MKKLLYVLSLLIIVSMILAACGTPAATEPPAVTEPAATEPAATQPPAATEPAATEPAAEADPNALPRNETLYFNGQQWGPVVCWNPYSTSCNNAMVFDTNERGARVTMFETPYMYNMLDGKQYPLLADGDYTWNADRTEITFKIKEAAHWSDGTPLTAEDVAYTWATHVKYESPVAAANIDYIENIEAVDPRRSWSKPN
jgi:peptide/nickel transport system substrate-binding protein